MITCKRWSFRILVVCVMLLLGAEAALGAPAAPSNVEVLPRYTAPIVLVVTWNDNSNDEDGFDIERREQGTAAYAPLASVGANVSSYVDNTATSDKMWEYRVRSTSVASGDSAWSASINASSPRQVWPIHDGDHDILHSFGTPLCWNLNRRYFHEGVDLSASGKRVDAGRGGRVTRVLGPGINGGQMDLTVDFGAGPEGDAYAHTVIDVTWGAGDLIAPGERIGTVNTNWFNMSVEADHSHWGDGHMFNLAPFTTAADRDPNMTAPTVGDINSDGHDLIVVDAANNDHANPRDPAWGDVDLLVDAFDDMAASMNLMVNPHRLGYWIQSGVSGGENVRSAGTPYRLVEFDFALAGPGPAGPVEDAVVYWDLPADLGGINTWQSCLTWRLTNTRGSDGTPGNVDANQFWRTDARKTTGTQPNGSDAQHARENQEARFPDGTYFVHVLLDDLEHSTDSVRSVLVDNSRPYVRRVTVFSGVRIVYQAQWVWDAGAAQLVLQPASFDAAAAFSALRTQDVTIEVEFSEPMQSASITSIAPLGVVPTLASTQSAHARTIWRGLISNLDIADDGTDDGAHMITIDGTDLAGNALLRIDSRASMGADHHNRDAGGAMRGMAGTDSIHGFKIGSLEGTLPVAVLFMKQGADDPATPSIADKALALQTALNSYFSEVSYGELSFAVSGYGWYQLAHPLAWYETLPQTPLVDLAQEAIASAQADGVTLSGIDYVLVVTDETASRPEWSTSGAWPYDVTGSPGWRLIAAGTLNLATPDARVTNLLGRMVGLIDLFAYPEVTVARPFVGPWSHMSDKEHDVHVLGWEKWRAGWLDETGTATGKTLTRVAKPAVGSPITNQDYTLAPLDTGADGVKMVAIDIGDRLHYTAEYRRQEGLDAGLPGAGVLIVKANDAVNQGEGPAIVQESPVTAGDLSDAPFTLTAPRDLFDDIGSGVSISVTSMDTNTAEIRLNYTIPPTENDVFVAPHDGRWQTEDIWVDAPDLTGGFAADPLTVKDAAEKPVVGQVNKVYGRVRNQGHADATNFEVHLEIREPWGAGGPWRSLKIDTVGLLQGQDTNAGDYYLIVAEWTPSGDVHSCVKLSVVSVANDITPDNNVTQENISQFATSAGSPYAPVTSQFGVENPYNEPVPVFFKVDGLPPGWSYILTPERLSLPPNGVDTAQVTLQPGEAAPVCSQELVTISAYTPRVDTLKRLGGISLQVALTNKAGVDLQSWAQCRPIDPKREQAALSTWTLYAPAQYAALYETARRECVIFAQGCTDPPMPNTQVAVVYTAPDGTKQVQYVTTDENGCYLDSIPASQPGLWQTQVVLEADECQAEARTSEQPVGIPGGTWGPCCGQAGCWWLFVLFVLVLVVALLCLVAALRGVRRAWAFFGPALLAAIALGWLFWTRCWPPLCVFLLGVAIALLLACLLACATRWLLSVKRSIPTQLRA